MQEENIFRKYRKKRGLNVKEVAKLLDISTSHIWNIENGNRSPGKVLIVKLCKLYGAKIEDLFLTS
jgi:transcriptional regulator with XRE-family HTH domain